MAKTKITLMYYPLRCSKRDRCTLCGEEAALSNHIECDYAWFDDVPVIVIKESNDITFSGIDGYGNWNLMIGKQKYDSLFCDLHLLKLDDVAVYEKLDPDPED